MMKNDEIGEYIFSEDVPLENLMKFAENYYVLGPTMIPDLKKLLNGDYKGIDPKSALIIEKNICNFHAGFAKAMDGYKDYVIKF
jgi:hypothetical protein